jgi:hypothetical protein
MPHPCPFGFFIYICTTSGCRRSHRSRRNRESQCPVTHHTRKSWLLTRTFLLLFFSSFPPRHSFSLWLDFWTLWAQQLYITRFGSLGPSQGTNKSWCTFLHPIHFLASSTMKYSRTAKADRRHTQGAVIWWERCLDSVVALIYRFYFSWIRLGRPLSLERIQTKQGIEPGGKSTGRRRG